jgi:hypothetical protein
VPRRAGLEKFSFAAVLNQTYLEFTLDFILIFASQSNYFLFPHLFVPSFCVILSKEYFSRRASLPSIVDIPFEYDRNPDTNDFDEKIHIHRYKDFYFVSQKTLLQILFLPRFNKVASE